jgi:hypothetical protein
VSSAAASGAGVKLRFEDGSSRAFDHVMLGTGYRVDVARYPFMTPRILDSLDRTNGYPILRGGLESSIPGLHFAGAPASWSFGPTMRFVSGSWYCGRAIAKAVAAAKAPPLAVGARGA